MVMIMIMIINIIFCKYNPEAVQTF